VGGAWAGSRRWRHGQRATPRRVRDLVRKDGDGETSGGDELTGEDNVASGPSPIAAVDACQQLEPEVAFRRSSDGIKAFSF
jgi:hypothetical protein